MGKQALIEAHFRKRIKREEESAGRSVCLAPSFLHSGLLMWKSSSFSGVLDASGGTAPSCAL